MEVKIINPEVLENLYKNHGTFACECYATPTKYAEKVGKSCEDNGHWSGSRCEFIKFRVTGLDRGTSEQCLRHEIGVSIPDADRDNWSFSDYSEQVVDVNPAAIVKNMASFRYIDKDGFDFATPDVIAKIPWAKREYDELMKEIGERRNKINNILVDNGVAKKVANEAVNMVLPRATATSFTIGFTPEALIHFCHKRLCTRAQEFIHELAVLMKREVSCYNARFAQELVPHCEYLLWCPEGDRCCGRKLSREDLKALLKSLGNTKELKDILRTNTNKE